MKITYEYIIIAILSIAFLYYFFARFSLLSDLFRVDDTNNPQLKAVKGKHRQCVPSPGGGVECGELDY